MLTRYALGAAFVLSSASLSFGAIVLPDSDDLRLDGRGAFDTSIEPYIDVTTGQLAAVGNEAVTIFGIGNIQTIFDRNSSAIGSFDGQITGVLSGTLGDALSVTPIDLGTSVIYTITSFVENVSIRFYYDAESEDLVIPDLFGEPVGDPPTAPVEATTGDLWLDLEGSAISTIVIQYNRDNGGDFASFTILSQTFSALGLEVVDGTFADQVIGNPDFLASQLGAFSSSFDTIVIDGITVNAPVDALIESTFNLTLTIPEPASLGLLAVGGLVLVGRPRRLA